MILDERRLSGPPELVIPARPAIGGLRAGRPLSCRASATGCPGTNLQETMAIHSSKTHSKSRT
jgi:hypothetical protein